MAAIRVMVVEDSLSFRTTLQALLNHIPALTVVATAQDGVEALPLIAETQPQLLLLDINMPQMGGWELLDELRRMNSPVRVIVLSAYPERYFKQVALDKGAAAFITKGNTYLLLVTLQTIIDNYLDI
jgi:CheY-like chemotaxis protein